MNVYCIPEYTPDIQLPYGSARVQDKLGRTRYVQKKYTHGVYSKQDMLYIHNCMVAMMEEFPSMLDIHYEAAPSNKKRLDKWLKELGIVDAVPLEGIEF
jgi:hypothetical protein